MSQKTFCDKCDQELVIPDEKIDFVTGQPTSGPGDLCWRCRLAELVDLYNEKTKEMENRPRFGLTFTTLGSTGKEPSWCYTMERRGGHVVES